MSASHSTMTVPDSPVSKEFDLGLQLSADFDLQPLFPHDRLLRLHPHWFVTDFKADGSSFSVDIKDYATEEEFFLTGLVVYPDASPELLRIELSGGLERKIIFLIRDGKLKVQVVSMEGEVVDNETFLLWIRGIREYIRIYLKRTPATLFARLLLNRMVLQMNPSQRKICMMIAKITVVEVLVIVLIVVGYVFFVQ
ncbi:MAG: hypothetical protein U9R66_06110 [Thermodesulfobacteriota bacterium]|nr:hypothetical protein [Thermodesulfobacteriota bacterium]